MYFANYYLNCCSTVLNNIRVRLGYCFKMYYSKYLFLKYKVQIYAKQSEVYLSACAFEKILRKKIYSRSVISLYN